MVGVERCGPRLVSIPVPERRRLRDHIRTRGCPPQWSCPICKSTALVSEHFAFDADRIAFSCPGCGLFLCDLKDA